MSQWFIDNAESYRANAKRDRDRGGSAVRLFNTTAELVRAQGGDEAIDLESAIALLVADDASERRAVQCWDQYRLRQVLQEVSGAPF